MHTVMLGWGSKLMYTCGVAYEKASYTYASKSNVLDQVEEGRYELASPDVWRNMFKASPAYKT